ncbi:2-amino-4-hydroxy-6-hydroxymethyldihydropteridine diphosphokinase [Aliiroseovarius crassostreae]|uniref:2-amino-4-hydroxy-6-hydroxymethyldihydropteridine pyrophosphokinase n=1 Tax=Aliiroseovarius crassostreae TaxID=154981 RepID=A0A9Q9LV77_9RHOB|nr:2-amino-4-hydroxy-6-hydroxymethyldihydropteridine diphosphokinase [Aliiroseovarius crassostreae]UWP95596.1 2-amino-4-hydroxy-6-hydroxymethyldihydropteridine diphosphokinase [Aliiroseovarius crassostreae]
MGKYSIKRLVALGSNTSSDLVLSHGLVRDAILQLEGEGVRINAISRFYRTPCFPAGAGPDFVNAAIEVQSPLSDRALLDLFHEVEAMFGRTRPSRWAPRSLDIDLLASGETIAPNPEVLREWIELPLEVQKRQAPDQLILPHPRLQDRGFVLIPLLDIAPDWCHPLLGKTVTELCEALPDAEKAEIVPIELG